MFKRVLPCVVAFSLALCAASAMADCQMNKLAELPVTMIDRRPVVSAQINGKDALFVADSGAFFSTISRPNAERYGLDLRMAPFGYAMHGVTGYADTSIGTAQEFTLANIPLHHVEFLVGGSELGDETVGLLGQNIFYIGDVEYDLANGAIRLFRAEHCGKYALVYWVKPDQAYSSISIESTTEQQPHTKGDVYVNGVRLTAMFDTGAWGSVMTLHAAARAGIKPDSPGVVFSGNMGGVGQHMTKNWVAPINSFKIGDEEIKSTHLRIADLELNDVDMLVGADFFLAHRVYVATSQRKMYFSYNGGMVFSLTPPSKAPASPAAAHPSLTPISAPLTEPSNASATPPPPISADEPTDAASYSRRGAAYTSRRQLDKALADLDRAVQLAPTNADYVYQRAMARLLNRQPLLAMTDVDKALELRPNDLNALILRGDLKLRSGDKPGAIGDFDIADKAADKLDDARFTLARGYAEADDLPAAIGQYDLWIKAHDADSRLAQARNGRCRARALLNQDLDQALPDCNAALRMEPHTANYLNSRGLVFLRLGQFDKSIRDNDEALTLNPKMATSLYERGLAKLDQGRTAEGQADIAAAVAIAPKLPESARKRGLAPPVIPAPSSPPAPAAPVS